MAESPAAAWYIFYLFHKKIHPVNFFVKQIWLLPLCWRRNALPGQRPRNACDSQELRGSSCRSSYCLRQSGRDHPCCRRRRPRSGLVPDRSRASCVRYVNYSIGRPASGEFAKRPVTPRSTCSHRSHVVVHYTAHIHACGMIRSGAGAWPGIGRLCLLVAWRSGSGMLQPPRIPMNRRMNKGVGLLCDV